MPEIAANVTEAVLVDWTVPVGDAFVAGDPLASVETEKAIVDLPAETAGVMLRHLVAAGALVPVGSPIAVLGAVGEAGDDVVALGADLRPEPVPAGGTRVAETHGSDAPPAGSSAPTAGSAAPPVGSVAPAASGRLFASPVARRRAHETGVDLADVSGTGPGGRIRLRDVEAFVAVRTDYPSVTAPTETLSGTAAQVEFRAGIDEVLVPATPARQGAAAQMTRALAAPHAYLQVEADVSGLLRLLDRLGAAHQAREGEALSLVPFVVKAVVAALERHPTFNAAWTDRGLIARRRIGIGVTVPAEGGLVAPVIRDAERRSINGLNAALADLAARARAGSLRAADVESGTFTIDTTGSAGSNLTLPTLNVPEVAILSVGAVTKRAVVLETPDGDVIAIRPVMTLVLGIDHRANDGAGAGRFLRDVKAWLEAVGPGTSVN